MAELIAYTDGGCRGNPGPGGWAFLLVDLSTSHALERAGGAPTTTNNRMEMQACIAALSALHRDSTAIVLRTDSRLVVDSCTQWLEGWKIRGWRRKDGPLLNVDLWQQLDVLQSRHRVRWEWVRGHAGDLGNEHVDRLANEAMDRQALGLDAAAERRFMWPTLE